MRKKDHGRWDRREDCAGRAELPGREPHAAQRLQSGGPTIVRAAEQPGNCGVISPIGGKLRMSRARRSNSELSRAARNLILAHGARAAGVAEIRARRLDECGEEEVAQTWREIGAFVRAIESGANPVPP
jgi:hypothetical protein